MKTITIILIGFLILGIISIGYYFDKNIEEVNMEEEERLYQGPVPEGYDEEHFRKTGETILIENG